MPSLLRRFVHALGHGDVLVGRLDLVPEERWAEYKAVAARSRELTRSGAALVWQIAAAKCRRFGLSVQEAWLKALQQLYEALQRSPVPPTEPAEDYCERLHDPVRHREELMERLLRLQELGRLMEADRERARVEKAVEGLAARDLIVL